MASPFLDPYRNSRIILLLFSVVFEGIQMFEFKTSLNVFKNRPTAFPRSIECSESAPVDGRGRTLDEFDRPITLAQDVRLEGLREAPVLCVWSVG